MESLNKDMTGIIAEYLDARSLGSLSALSKSVFNDIKLLQEDVTFWKQRVHHLVGIELPFTDNTVDYWRKLADKLEVIRDNPDKLIELFRKGKYDFVYIAMTLNKDIDEKDAETALLAAAEKDYDASIRFILDNSKWKNELKLPFKLPLTTAAAFGKNKALKALLEYSIKVQAINVIVHGIYTPLEQTIMQGNLVGFKLIMDKYPITSDNEWIDVLYKIYNNAIRNRIELLKDLLSMEYEPDSEIAISDYVDGTKGNLVSEEEMKIMLESPLFRVSRIYILKKLSPEAAYLLYIFDDNSNYGKPVPDEYRLDNGKISKYKTELFEIIIPNSDLLEKALNYAMPPDMYGPKYFAIALTNEAEEDKFNGAESGIVIMNHYAITNETIAKAIRYCIPLGFQVKSVKYACIKANITEQDLEVMIMEETRLFINNSVRHIIELEIKLRRNDQSRYLIGEKVAFNCADKGWDQLYKAGFDFNSCGTDLLKKITESTSDTFLVAHLKKYVTRYDQDVYYGDLMLPQGHIVPRVKSNISKKEFDEAHKFNRLFIDSINLQDAEKAKSLIPKVSWKNMKQLGWIAVVPSSLIPHLQDGIKYIKKYFENIILRDVTANRKQGRDKTGRNLMYWLILARDLYDKLTISIVNNKTTISIGDTIVRFDHDVTAKGKYKGLDMFSDKGIPLTTRQEIKERRAELQRA